MNRDRGIITVWVLGMTLVVMFLGWLGIGMWSAFAERQQLSAAADLAARAGATALDTVAYRQGAGRQLDPDVAEQRAWESLAAQDLGPLTVATVHATTTQVVVELERDLDSGVYNLFSDGDEPLRAHVRAIARPRE